MWTQFTSESVCAGHPDKICDQISDAILDEALAADPNSRVAVEVMVTQDLVVLAGEVTSQAKLNYEAIARREIKRLGYTDASWGFWDQSPIKTYIHEQSPDISIGVNDGGAGDQGMMFGYACRQTPELMPAPIILAHRLARALDDLTSKHDELRPDGKTQVTLNYKDGVPLSIETIVAATPHSPRLDQAAVTSLLLDPFIAVCREYQLELDQEQLIVNGTGRWEIGGPSSDTGVTGRKIVVDTYGGYARVGGGCFSGKDASKVDRSGAYAARYMAKNIVAAGLADECEVGLAYAIGHCDPVWVEINTFGTGKKSDAFIWKTAKGLLPLSVKGIIDTLDLKRSIYQTTAAYGHFGYDAYPWEAVVI